MSRVAEVVPVEPFVLRLRPEIELTDDQLFDLCQRNRALRLERTADGEILILPPEGGESGRSNAEAGADLVTWARRDGSGVPFGSSTGFRLPNGAMRSPDAAWVRRERWEALSSEERRKFPPLVPDFVIEVRSPSDRVRDLEAKMVEYLACGARLGWLIDPLDRRVTVYREGAAPETLLDPGQVSGEPLLPGFVLDLGPIFSP